MALPLLPLLLLTTPSTPTPLHTYAALTGRPSYKDVLLLCLGMQAPLTPTSLNEGEYPACAAMTTGYVFRVENQATVMFLRRVGRTGCLTTLDVFEAGTVRAGAPRIRMAESESKSQSKSPSRSKPQSRLRSQSRPRSHSKPQSRTRSKSKSKSHSRSKSVSVSKSANYSISATSILRYLIYTPPLLALTFLSTTLDPYLLLTISLLLVSRALSIATLRARTSPTDQWHGEREPGVHGDLLVLLSEDRWVRMRGLVDDLKAVTSGSWLSSSSSLLLSPPNPDDDDQDQDPHPTLTSHVNATATARGMLLDALDFVSRLLVPLAAVTLCNARNSSRLSLTACVLLSHVMLAWRNVVADVDAETGLLMNGRRVVLAPGKVKRYSRRLVMAEELISEVGRRDWAVRLGMVNPERKGEGEKEQNADKANGGEVVDEVITM